MERVTVGMTKALRLYDSGGKTGPIEIGGVGRKGLFYVRLQEGDPLLKFEQQDRKIMLVQSY